MKVRKRMLNPSNVESLGPVKRQREMADRPLQRERPNVLFGLQVPASPVEGTEVREPEVGHPAWLPAPSPCGQTWGKDLRCPGQPLPTPAGCRAAPCTRAPRGSPGAVGTCTAHCRMKGDGQSQGPRAAFPCLRLLPLHFRHMAECLTIRSPVPSLRFRNPQSSENMFRIHWAASPDMMEAVHGVCPHSMQSYLSLQKS